MPINALHVGNFKGLGDTQTIDIAPITLFIGANSSGKSSCIHALSSLSQTTKLPNNTTSLVLDDDFAYVHLGRFIEVVHSKKYTDEILLGITIKDTPYISLDDNKELVPKTGNLVASYKFGCTKRTQDIYLKSCSFEVGNVKYSVVKRGNKYEATNLSARKKMILTLKRGFFFEESSFFTKDNDIELPRLFIPLSHIQFNLAQHLQNLMYLGPFRQSPQRRYPTRGSSPTEVGSQGEATATLLANEVVQTKSKPHIKQIIKWLDQMGLAKDLNITRVGKSDQFDLLARLNDGENFPIADLGYGLSQVLPVLTQCSFAKKGATLLFEQPELHLHSIAARKLAKVFIETSKTKNIHIIAETHSPELVKQFQTELREGNISLDDLIVYRVSRKNGQTVLKKLEIDADDFDILENWEHGISIEAPT